MTETILIDPDQNLLGKTEVMQPYPVTAVDIAKFALSIGATDPVYFDRDAAIRCGYQGVIAPLGYYTTIRIATRNLAPLSQLGPDGASSSDAPPNRATKHMAGAVDVTFHRRIADGDVITLHKQAIKAEEKVGRSGPLALVTYEMRYVAADGEEVVTETYVRIFR